MKKKIIIFHQNFSTGGVENSTIFLSNYLKKNNFDIHFASNFQKQFNFKLLNGFKIKKFPFQRLRYNFFHIFFYLLKLKKIDKNFLVISNQFNMNIFLLIIKKFIKFKIIITERNHPSEIKYKNFFLRVIYYFLINMLYNDADSRVGNSKVLSLEYSRISNSRFQTIYNSYNYKIIKKKSKQYKINKNKKFIYNFIFIARLVDRKNPILAVNIIDEIIKLKKNKNFASLTIIGNGYLKKKLDNLIFQKKLKNNIKIISFKKNHYPYYLNSDFLLSLSKFEGFPNVLIEALTLNVLPICYNYKSGPSEILLNSKGGIVFDKLNPSLIAKFIIKNIKNKNILKKKLIEGKKNIQQFDHTKILFRYYELINKLK